MRGTVKQGKQRVKLAQPLSGFVVLVGTQHALRLVDDKYRARFANHIDRPPPAKLFQFRHDAACIGPGGIKSLRIDNHHVYLRVGGKLVDGRKPGTVVNKVLHALAIFFGKMVGHGFKALDNALAYGHTGHHDDELSPAIVFVKFVHRLDVGIGFARTRFHFDAQCQCAVGIAKHMVYGLQFLTHLYFAYVAC